RLAKRRTKPPTPTAESAAKPRHSEHRGTGASPVQILSLIASPHGRGARATIIMAPPRLASAERACPLGDGVPAGLEYQVMIKEYDRIVLTIHVSAESLRAGVVASVVHLNI